jgi:hypothetical protein
MKLTDKQWAEISAPRSKMGGYGDDHVFAIHYVDADMIRASIDKVLASIPEQGELTDETMEEYRIRIEEWLQRHFTGWGRKVVIRETAKELLGVLHIPARRPAPAPEPEMIRVPTATGLPPFHPLLTPEPAPKDDTAVMPLEAVEKAVRGMLQECITDDTVRESGLWQEVLSRLIAAPKPTKQDAAVEAALPIIRGDEGYKFFTYAEQAREIVAAVRKADAKGASHE